MKLLSQFPSLSSRKTLKWVPIHLEKKVATMILSFGWTAIAVILELSNHGTGPPPPNWIELKLGSGLPSGLSRLILKPPSTTSDLPSRWRTAKGLGSVAGS